MLTFVENPDVVLDCVAHGPPDDLRLGLMGDSPRTYLVVTALRSEPGPLLLRRIDTGAGALRLDAAFGGVTVAEVQADLGQHGVTVESHPDRFIYQSEATLFVRGEGFFPGNTTLRWANGLRGKGVNYTTSTSASPNQLTLLRNTETDTAGKQTHKWRNNPKNLPGPLVLLAVNAGAGWVPVGPTEMKKGRTVATVFEDVYNASSLQGKQWLGVLGNHDYGGYRFTAGWDQAIGYTWVKPADAVLGRWMTPAQYWGTRVQYSTYSVDYYFVDSNHFADRKSVV